MSNLVCAEHLREYLNFDDLKRLIKETTEALAKHEFDAIAFSGLSGAMLAPMVAMNLHKPMLAVRKPEEKRHSTKLVEGDYDAKTYVIVDDFVSSGSTVARIVDAIYDIAPEAKCIGIYNAVDTWIDPKGFWDWHQLENYSTHIGESRYAQSLRTKTEEDKIAVEPSGSTDVVTAITEQYLSPESLYLRAYQDWKEGLRL